MDYVAVVLAALAVIMAVIVAAIVAVFLALRRLWRNTKPGQTAARGVIVALGLGIIASCYVGLKIHERNFVLARVPAPLDVAEIEYRQEELWGLGFMPGDNETGLVIYRLSDKSAEWARSKGNQLPDALLG
jgi:membrane protease YdiL (CAAX protease family)